MVNLGILGTAVAPAGILIDKIQAGFYWLMLLIDTTLAWVSDVLFNIFFALAKVNIFSQEAYADIVKRVYIVLGLIMLFALAYSLLKAVINPDEFAKGEYSFPKLIQNVVVSLIIIAVLPTVFSMATNFQNAILNEGTIPKIILGKDTATDSCDAGRSFSYHILSAFLFPNKEWCTENNYSLTKDSDGKEVTDSNASECAENIKTSDGSIFHAGQSLSEITNEFLNDNSKPSIKIFVNFNEAAVDGEMTYLVVISTIAMIFLLIAILNFCFDMAIRIFRLIFFEIIAPIPVICRIIPGGKMKDVFGTWVKKTLSTFADIFIRLVVIYFVLFLFDKINEARQSIVLPCLNVVTSKLAWALVYMGLIAFMRQAPKVICDLFHLDPGNLKMGFGDLKDKFAEGGGFVAGAAIGAGATSLARNFVASTFKRDEKGRLKFKPSGILPGVASGVAGAARGFGTAGRAALNAKNFGDVKKSASAGAAKALERRVARSNYKAKYNKGYTGPGRFVGQPFVNLFHHGADAMGQVANWAGFENIEEMRSENKLMDEITNARDTFDNNVDAKIDKEVAKGKTDMWNGEINLSDVQAAQDALNDARLGNGNIREAQKTLDDARKAVRYQLQNKLLMSKEKWDVLGADLKKDFSDLRKDGVVYKGSIANNASLEALKNAGIVGSDFAQDKDFVLGVPDGDGYKDKDTIDKMNENIKVYRGDNNVNIATKQQSANDEETKKK